jgi:hypothetical protein
VKRELSGWSAIAEIPNLEVPCCKLAGVHYAGDDAWHERVSAQPDKRDVGSTPVMSFVENLVGNFVDRKFATKFAKKFATKACSPNVRASKYMA